MKVRHAKLCFFGFLVAGEVYDGFRASLLQEGQYKAILFDLLLNCLVMNTVIPNLVEFFTRIQAALPNPEDFEIKNFSV